MLVACSVAGLLSFGAMLEHKEGVFGFEDHKSVRQCILISPSYHIWLWKKIRENFVQRVPGENFVLRVSPAFVRVPPAFRTLFKNSSESLKFEKDWDCVFG